MLFTVVSQIWLLMGQLHTVRQYNSPALLPMHTFILLKVVRVFVCLHETQGSVEEKAW